MVPCPVCRARYEALALPADRTALDAMLQDARREQAQEDMEKCKFLADLHWKQFKQSPADDPNRGNPYVEGLSSGADECADAIRQAAGVE